MKFILSYFLGGDGRNATEERTGKESRKVIFIFLSFLRYLDQESTVLAYKKLI